MKVYIVLLTFLSVFFSQAVLSEDSEASMQKSEVQFSIDIHGDNFDELKLAGYNGHPLQMFMTHPNSGREYRFEVIISEIFHADELMPKVYLKVSEQDISQGEWLERASYELISPYDNDVQFSTLSENGEGIKGDIRVSSFELDKLACSDSQIEYDENSGMQVSPSSCCSAKCLDGSGQRLSCCGAGATCCGCGVCCQAP